MNRYCFGLALLSILDVACNDKVPTSVFEWVQSRKPVAGTTQSMDLPVNLVRESKDGKAYAAWLKDGRLCVLIKTRIGYKDNFKGAVRCSGGVREEDIISSTDRPYLSLSGYGIFEELYIGKRISDSELAVFFDLY